MKSYKPGDLVFYIGPHHAHEEARVIAQHKLTVEITFPSDGRWTAETKNIRPTLNGLDYVFEWLNFWGMT
jgi:hypothetical protein